MVSPAPLDLEVVRSPAWLDSVLGPRFPGVRVAATEIVEELRTIAAKVRFRVDYEAHPSGAPDAMCVKGYFGADAAVAASVGQIEARFYTDIAPRIAVRVPPCAHAGIDDDTQGMGACGERTHVERGFGLGTYGEGGKSYGACICSVQQQLHLGARACRQVADVRDVGGYLEGLERGGVGR